MHIVIGKIKMKIEKDNKIIIKKYADENTILTDYYILPYYDKNSLVYIIINDNNEIEWYNYNFKKIQSYKKINKNLLKCYSESKFNRL